MLGLSLSQEPVPATRTPRRAPLVCHAGGARRVPLRGRANPALSGSVAGPVLVRRAALALVALAAHAAFAAHGEDSPGDDGRELDGAEIVARAVEAAGGDAWQHPRTLYLEGEMWLYRDGLLEAETHADDYRMWRAFPEASEAAHAASGKLRLEARSGDELVFLASFDGRHTYDRHGRVEDERAAEQWSSAFGFGILRYADRKGFRVLRLADDQVAGYPSHFIEVIDPAGGRTVFGIDRESYAIRKVGFATPRGWHERVYSGFEWHEDPPFRQPGRVRLYYDGRKTNEVRWHDYRVNAPIADEIFILSNGVP